MLVLGCQSPITSFWHACTERGITPVLGCERYFVEDAARQIARGDENRHHLTLLTRDSGGYRNVVSLVGEAWLYNCFRDARGLVDWALREKYHEGLICLSGCYDGSFPLTVIRKGGAEGERELRRHLDLFGGDFHPEMSRIGFEVQEISNRFIIEFAPRHGLKPVVTNDVHYPFPEDWIAHDIIIKSRFGKVSDFSIGTREIWLKGEAEMRALGFDAVHYDNTVEVAQKCRVRTPGRI